MVEKHWDGIVSYCQPDNKVSLGLVEGINNVTIQPQSATSGLICFHKTPGFPLKQQRQCLRSRQAMLATRRQVTANPTEDFSPSIERKYPEIFCCTLVMRRSFSPWLLVKGTLSTVMKHRTSDSKSRNRSSRFLAFDRLSRPRFPLR